MIKVLQVITDTNIGGAGRLLIHYLKCFDRSRFDMAVVVPSGSQLIPLIESEGYRVIETKYSHDKSYEKGATGEFKEIFRKEKPDIVHCHASFAGKAAAYLTGVKSRIYTRHCVFEMPKRLTTFPGKQINGLINNTLSTTIIAVVRAAADNLTETGINPNKIHIIMNGVEKLPELSEEEKLSFRSSLGIDKNTFVGLISARMEDYKGHSFLIDAAKTVRDSLPEDKKVFFIFMGDGSIREQLMEQAKQNGTDDIILFTGFVSDVVPYCNIMNLNLNSSWGTEASSLALAEGMSLGKPAVVTDFGGNPDVITDGLNGLVVPQKNADAMAEAILKLINDPALTAKLSRGAEEEYARKFSSVAMTRQLEKVYEEEYATRCK